MEEEAVAVVATEETEVLEDQVELVVKAVLVELEVRVTSFTEEF